jgi:glycosyltransferase involved in cell wall biosynthesis
LLLEQKWGIKLPAQTLTTLVRPDRLQTLPVTDPLVFLYHCIFPEACRLFRDLQEISDLPGETNFFTELTTQKTKYLPLSNQQFNKPTLAIIVPTFNQGDLLIEAIASVERIGSKLTPGVIELQVVNDGSSEPRTLAILKNLAQIGYRILHQPNLGLSAARNAGLRATTAPLVLPLDDDNYLLEGYLIPGLNIMQQEQHLAVLYGDRQDFGLIEGRFQPDIKDATELWRMNRIDACALIRREWIELCGGYDENLSAFEDWDLWLSILRRGGQMGYLPLPCFAYRHRPNSMIRRYFASEQRQQEVMAILRRKHYQTAKG